MNETLSLNTKAILLLTAPLLIGRGKAKEPIELLKPGEYTKFALYLQERDRQPADLLGSDADQILRDCRHILEKDRLMRLLDRGFLLSQTVERWHTRAIWVMSRADDSYPQRLKAQLKKDSPSLLYGCGDKEILNSGGLAVVGSRNANGSLLEYTQQVGRLAAQAGRTVVSGGARGIDQAATSGASEAGGRVTGVLADSLERTVLKRENRDQLLEGQLVLISPYDPNAGFNAGHAMQRNKLIYALADVALVVNADLNKGGTWAGATEQLEKLHLVPVFVRSNGGFSKSLEALKNKGAMPWPNPADANDLNAVFQSGASKTPIPLAQSDLPFDLQQEPVAPGLQAGAKPELQVAEAPNPSPAEELYQTIRSLIIRMLVNPRKAAEIAVELNVTKPQAEEWLKRLVAEGILEKSGRPVRYIIRQNSLPGK